MRLIDAVLVIERLGRDIQQMDDPVFMMMIAAVISDIRHAPTVDAIPVEWIKKYMSRCLAIEQYAIGEMVKEWAEKEEE